MVCTNTSRRYLESIMSRECPALLLTATLFLFLPSFADAVAADANDYYYDFINADIYIRPDGVLKVTETHSLMFVSGDFHYGRRCFTTDKAYSIDSIEVWEHDRKYQLDSAVRQWIEAWIRTGESPGGNTYAFTHWTEEDKFCVEWWFPRTTGGGRTFLLRYRVKDAVKFGTKNDTIQWEAIFRNREALVRSSRVSIHLPQVISPQVLDITTTGVTVERKTVENRTVEVTTGSVPEREGLGISISFPHGVVAWKQAKQEGDSENWALFIAVMAILVFIMILIGIIGGNIKWSLPAYSTDNGDGDDGNGGDGDGGNGGDGGDGS